MEWLTEWSIARGLPTFWLVVRLWRLRQSPRLPTLVFQSLFHQLSPICVHGLFAEVGVLAVLYPDRVQSQIFPTPSANCLIAELAVRLG